MAAEMTATGGEPSPVGLRGVMSSRWGIRRWSRAGPHKPCHPDKHGYAAADSDAELSDGTVDRTRRRDVTIGGLTGCLAFAA